LKQPSKDELLETTSIAKRIGILLRVILQYSSIAAALVSTYGSTLGHYNKR
jgi:hypothetical protein